MLRSQSDKRTSLRTGAFQFDELTAEEQNLIRTAVGDDHPIERVALSDLHFDGTYGRSVVVLTDRSLHVVEHTTLRHSIDRDAIRIARAREFVGNGVLEIYTTDGSRDEIARFSRTCAGGVAELSDLLNADKTGEESAQSAGDQPGVGTTAKATYRCSNCGHPLASPWDACPNCADVKHVMRRLLQYLKPYWPIVVFSQIVSLLVTVTALGPGFLIRILMDTSLDTSTVGHLSMQARSERLMWIAFAFFGLILARYMLQGLRIRLMGYLGQRVVYELRSGLYRAFQRLSLSYYDREHSGKMMSRMLSDTRAVQRFMNEGIQQIVIDVLMIAGIAIILFSEAPGLATIALLPIPVVVVIGRTFSTRFRGIFRSVRRKYANLSSSVNEAISGIRVVRSFAQEDREIATFDQKNEELFSAFQTAIRTRARFNPLIIFLLGIGTVVVWFVGGQQVLAGAITIGLLTQFVTYMNQFYPPVQQLLNMTEMFQESATAAERLFSVMDTPLEISDHDDARDISEPKGHIVFDNVRFGYDTGETVLKDINFELEAGKMLGLVGQTGAGKSTLVSLVCRFYDPTEGRILLDGLDLKDISTKSLRSSIGMVLQESFLFAGSIKDNIAYGKPEATEEEIIEAARAANAHDFIMNLPDAYDSAVGERGVTLSGGERQRVSIARAILKDPAILILDEATSAVDTATEVAIQGAIDRLVSGRTTIAIAHRLSTLRNADRLLVLENGEVLEEGSHEDLLNANGKYAELVRIQADFARSLE